MGQEDIYRLLKEEKRFMKREEIAKKLGITDNAVYTSLRKMKKSRYGLLQVKKIPSDRFPDRMVEWYQVKCIDN